MKNAPLLSGVLLVLTASIASAGGGMNLAWNDCYGAGGVTNRNFACNTNTGTNDLYVSFEPPDTIYALSGSNQWLDLQSAGTTLPQWWQFKNAGACRQASLGSGVGPGSCMDAWQQQAVAGIFQYATNSQDPSMPPNRARILGGMSHVFAATGLLPGTEYFCIQLRINNAKTVGLGSCAGCSGTVCIVLNEVLLTTLNQGDIRLHNALASNYVTWQGGAVGGVGCPLATPTINRTWGQVKSIYR